MIVLQLILYCLLFTAMVKYAVRGGAVDGLYFYPKTVQDRAIEIELITRENMQHKRKIFMTEFYIVMLAALVLIIGLWRVIYADGVLVGNISVELKSDVYRKDGEIGYLLGTEYWSRGIMTEAVRQMCGLAFAELDIVRITGLVYAPNAASQRVLEKNGFIREGLQRSAVYKSGRFYDLCLFGKVKYSDFVKAGDK